MDKLISLNPSTGQVLGEVAVSTEEEIATAFTSAHKAKLAWKELGVAKRVELLRPIIAEFKQREGELALLISQEMGMTRREANIEIADSVAYAEWYFDNAESALKPEITFEDDKVIHQIVYEPYGVVVDISPWNFPLSNFIWSAMQSLIAGNVIIHKHSEECPLFAVKIAEIFAKHNLPVGVYTEIFGDGAVGAQLLIEKVDLISFKGSNRTGELLAELAAKKFTKYVVELGGSAPGIVFADADIDAAVENIYYNRFANCGQMCDALKRLIVHVDVAEVVIAKLKALIASKKIGIAENEDIDLGPLVAKRQVDVLKEQVRDAISQGAQVVCGGDEPAELVALGGFFYNPTILTGINKTMRVWTEELFGPVLPIVTFTTEDEAVELANDTKYGLGGYVYTTNAELAERVASRMETGMVSVNGVSYVLPCNPFGGYKHSGVGREHGRQGFYDVS